MNFLATQETYGEKRLWIGDLWIFLFGFSMGIM